MYLLNKDTASRRAIVFKNGNESIAVNAEMVKFASQQIGCSEQEIYKFLEGGEETPQIKTMQQILLDRAANKKK